MATDKPSTSLFVKIGNNKKLNWVIKFTQIFVISIILVLIFLDIILYSKEEETISELIGRLAYGNWYVFSWIWGVLAAHMFFTRTTRVIKNEATAVFVIIALSVLIYLSSFVISIGDSIITQIVFLILGGLGGYYIWPQTFDKPEKIGSIG